MYHPNSLIFQYITLFLQDESWNFFFFKWIWTTLSAKHVLVFHRESSLLSSKPRCIFWSTCQSLLKYLYLWTNWIWVTNCRIFVCFCFVFTSIFPVLYKSNKYLCSMTLLINNYKNKEEWRSRKPSRARINCLSEVRFFD